MGIPCPDIDRPAIHVLDSTHESAGGDSNDQAAVGAKSLDDPCRRGGRSCDHQAKRHRRDCNSARELPFEFHEISSSPTCPFTIFVDPTDYF